MCPASHKKTVIIVSEYTLDNLDIILVDSIYKEYYM